MNRTPKSLSSAIPPVFVIRKQPGEPEPAVFDGPPFPLLLCPPDILIEIWSYLSAPHFISLYNSGSSVLQKALVRLIKETEWRPELPALFLEDGDALAHLYPSDVFPSLVYFTSLKSLTLSNLNGRYPWARAFAHFAPPNLEFLDLTIDDIMIHFFNDNFVMEDYFTDMDSIKKYSSKRVNQLSFYGDVDFNTYAVFSRLSQLHTLSLRFTKYASQIVTPELYVLLSTLPPSLTFLRMQATSFFEPVSFPQNPDSSIWSQLPQKLKTLCIPNWKLTPLDMAFLRPNLTALEVRPFSQIKEESAALLPMTLTSLDIITVSGWQRDFWPELSKRTKLKVLNMSCGLLSSMAPHTMQPPPVYPPALTRLSLSIATMTPADLTLLPNTIRILAIEASSLLTDSNVAKALPPRLTHLTFFLVHNSVAGTPINSVDFISYLPRGLVHLDTNMALMDHDTDPLHSGGANKFSEWPPCLTYLRYISWQISDLAIAQLPKTLLTLHMSEVSDGVLTLEGMAQLPPKLTSLRLKLPHDLPSAIAPLLPKSLSELELNTVNLDDMPTQKVDKPEEEDLLDILGVRPRKVVREADLRVTKFIETMPDGVVCKFWLRYKAKRVGKGILFA